MSADERRDMRRERGDQTRRSVAKKAAALASVHGLTNISLAQVADEIGMSKSSVQAAFRTKEELQLAAVEAASRTFVAAVVVPALGKPAGLARLWALVDGFLVYVERRVFPGGCFMGATFAECDSHPGPLRDALVGVRAQWLAVLEHAITTAKRAGDLSRNPTAADLAFEIDALLAAANVARNLTDDDSHLKRARRLIALRLSVPAPRMKRWSRASVVR